VARVLPLVSHPSPDVRIAAAEALGELGSASAVSALTDALRDSDELVRVYAAEALGRIRSPLAVRALRKLTLDRRWLPRAYAYWALAEIGGPEMTALFKGRLKTERNLAVRLRLLNGLVVLGDTSYFGRMLRMLLAADYRVRAAAVFFVDERAPSLSEPLRLDAKRALKGLLPNEQTRAVRSAATAALAHLRATGRRRG